MVGLVNEQQIGGRQTRQPSCQGLHAGHGDQVVRMTLTSHEHAMGDALRRESPAGLFDKFLAV